MSSNASFHNLQEKLDETKQQLDEALELQEKLIDTIRYLREAASMIDSVAGRMMVKAADENAKKFGITLDWK